MEEEIRSEEIVNHTVEDLSISLEQLIDGRTDGVIIFDYLYMYNRDLYNIVMNYTMHKYCKEYIFGYDLEAALLSLDERFVFEVGLLLGKIAALNWILGGTLDTWDCKYTYDHEIEVGKMRNVAVVAGKCALYLEAMWLERRKRPESHSNFNEYKESGDCKKIDIAKGAYAGMWDLQLEHQNEPIFNIDSYKVDYGLMNGVLLGKISVCRWYMGYDFDDWNY